MNYTWVSKPIPEDRPSDENYLENSTTQNQKNSGREIIEKLLHQIVDYLERRGVEFLD